MGGRQRRTLVPAMAQPEPAIGGSRDCASVKRNRSDAADAAALLEAARASAKHPVRVKSVAQQALQGVHRIRSIWMGSRTARINALRGFIPGSPVRWQSSWRAVAKPRWVTRRHLTIGQPLAVEGESIFESLDRSGRSRQQTPCKPHQHQSKQWNIQQKRELHASRPAKGSIAEVAPPVDETCQREKHAKDWNQPNLV